jgi:hypothetical protein
MPSMFTLEAAARIAIREGVEFCGRYSGSRALEGRRACPKKMESVATRSAVGLQRRLALLGAALSAFSPGPAFAQVQLPAVNLGQTSFEDGFAGPGWIRKLRRVWSRDHQRHHRNDQHKKSRCDCCRATAFKRIH